MSFRDWPRTLRQASFRGVSFHVEKDTVETGRRLVIHEFPLKDDPYIEDLGRDTNKLNVTAYLVGNDVDSGEKSLRSACEQRGAASLVLPLERFRVHCEKCSRDASKDKLGYIAFQLSFVREGSGSGPFPIQLLGFALSSVVDGVLAPLRAAFSAVYQGIGLAGYIATSGTAQVRTVAAMLDDITRTSPLAVAALPQLRLRVQDLYDQAPTLIRTGEVADRLTDRSFVATAEVAQADAPIVGTIHTLIRDIAAAAAPEPARALLETLITFDADTSHTIPPTPNRRRERDNLAAIAAVVRIAALTAYVEAVARARYPDRRSAIQARADVAELIAAEIERAALARNHELYTAIEDMRGRAVDLLSRRITDLAPVVTVSAPRSMPALWWSNRLYGDAQRAAELVARNRIKHSGFMPIEFEALAS